MAHVDELLTILLSQKGSDLHLRSGLAPFMRTHGEMKPLPDQPVQSREHCLALIMEIMPEPNRLIFKKEWDTDFAYEMKGVGRFRVNVFEDRQGIGAVMRTIPVKPLTADQLNLPAVVREFCYLKKGLVVVTGPTGSGKSTTLAAMIDHINRNRQGHVICIEDPIEYVHRHGGCTVEQIEIGEDAPTFTEALRNVFRQTPDVIMVGEMRDLETIALALTLAETGHLILATLHTQDTANAVNRIVDSFPSDQQAQIFMQLSMSLVGIVSQQLLITKDRSRRVMACEVLRATSAVRNQIREGAVQQLYSVLQTSRGEGMQSMEESLRQMHALGLISDEQAMSRSSRPKEMQRMLRTKFA